MNATRIGAVILRQVYLFRGSPARVLPLFIWVAIDMMMWGFMTRYLNTVSSPGQDFIPSLLGAVLLWDFFGRVMHGVATAFLEDVWAHNFLNFFASPLTIAEYLTGLVTVSIVTSAVGMAAMYCMASAVFGLSFFSYGLMILPFLFVLFLFGISLGVLASAMVLRYGPAAEWFVWPIPALFAPFSGVFYPISILPSWMLPVSWLLPPTYVFEGMRGIIAGKGASPSELAIGTALGIFYLVLSCVVFLRVYKGAQRSGLIARYAAESIN